MQENRHIKSYMYKTNSCKVIYAGEGHIKSYMHEKRKYKIVYAREHVI